MLTLATDLGTTHYKAAVIELDSTLVSQRSKKTVTEYSPDDSYFYDPDKLLGSKELLIDDLCTCLS